MKKAVQHIFSLFLLLGFLLSATGVHFHRHVCSTCHTSNYSIIVEPQCACDIAHQDCETSVQEKNCQHSCHTDHQFLKLKDEYIYSNYSFFKANWITAILPLQKATFSLIKNTIQDIYIYQSSPPPEKGKIISLNSQYRL